MTKFTPERIAELRAICNAATPEPWTAGRFGSGQPSVVSGKPPSGDTTIVLFEPCQKQDGDFIAAARTGYPAALDEIEKCHERRCHDEHEIERLRGLLRDCVGTWDNALPEDAARRQGGARIWIGYAELCDVNETLAATEPIRDIRLQAKTEKGD